ncbi:uncharacterized protein TRUGW13939_09843 [Talaromyces rugulosus]|uniref:Uncharacterized protein n=1 Tax=Talaromyces rugulosus TaxID=121627 RepID=A0A7H8R8G2_TALRU|nr:uncharacterized protein TRUGW13939_09843 [Talaromyces rugulosus]QKX62682.1 hypothetical protein TRUGW13939_09843 [Talaromyces rugulosus]
MATSGPNPVPPTQILTTRSISQSAALDFLSAYLDRAANDPSLQPSAMITEHGPISRTTAAAPNLTLHNLKRVQAGLAGETLGRDLTLSTGSPPKPEEKEEAEEGGADGVAQWEDMQKWELEAGEGLTKDRSADFTNTTEAQVEVDQDGMPVDAPIDKEERKRRKKERKQLEKKARQQREREAGEEDLEKSE